MTSAQRTTIQRIEDALEAQRFIAAQAARELATMDEFSVALAVQVLVNEGRTNEARAMWRAYRDAQKETI